MSDRLSWLDLALFAAAVLLLIPFLAETVRELVRAVELLR